jgi:agmatinase
MKLYYANADLNAADFVILGLPYDRTSSFIPGSRFAPQFIRMCSENVEDYSPYQNRSVSDLRICDLEDIVFTTKEWFVEAQKATENILSKKKRFVFLGGEHTVTVPVVQAFKRQYGDLSVVQFDAHCDLRDEYLGEEICHATAMRRVCDIIGPGRLYQFGIRSGTREEFSFGKHLYKFRVAEHLLSVVESIPEPIYITIDIDVLNPGAVPAVSTPEPGGIAYNELAGALLTLKKKKIIGADIVEYNPLAASPWASGSTVAELLRELLLIMTPAAP